MTLFFVHFTKICIFLSFNYFTCTLWRITIFKSDNKIFVSSLLNSTCFFEYVKLSLYLWRIPVQFSIIFNNNDFVKMSWGKNALFVKRVCKHKFCLKIVEKKCRFCQNIAIKCRFCKRLPIKCWFCLKISRRKLRFSQKIVDKMPIFWKNHAKNTNSMKQWI